jgi:hypothetical protein
MKGASQEKCSPTLTFINGGGRLMETVSVNAESLLILIFKT